MVASPVYLMPEQCRRRLECLQRVKASVLRLGEAPESGCKTGRCPPRSAVLTFDYWFAIFWNTRRIERREMSTAGNHEIAPMVANNLGIDYRAILQRRILQILSPLRSRKWRVPASMCNCILTGIGHRETGRSWRRSKIIARPIVELTGSVSRMRLPGCFI